MGALCLAAFSLVMFGWGHGQLGRGCNSDYLHTAPDGAIFECETVFRARATTFVCMTWFCLFLAWEMIHMRRSFFRLQPDSRLYLTQWMHDVWRNKFLFCGIVVGFVTIFPVLYIPVINDVVFKHTGISWEWGVVFVEGVLFILGIEAWKWCKRIYFRRKVTQEDEDDAKLDPLRARTFSQYTSRSRSDIEDMKTGKSMV